MILHFSSTVYLLWTFAATTQAVQVQLGAEERDESRHQKVVKRHMSVKHLIRSGRLASGGSLYMDANTYGGDGALMRAMSGSRLGTETGSPQAHLRPPRCPVPVDWCSDFNGIYYNESDCNGDGVLDRVCDTYGAPESVNLPGGISPDRGDRRWIMLSGNCDQHNTGDAPKCEELSQVTPSAPADESTCPSMFVVIISSLSNKDRRTYLRQMWADAPQGWGKLEAKFGLCVSGGISSDIRREAEQHGDILYLDCEEGYLNGRLTLKVITSMRAYLEHYGDYDLFMKTDDDTFVSARRLCGFMNWRADHGKDNLKAYFGVFAEGETENMYSLHKVNRDETSPWFEAIDDYPYDEYPTSAKGGPGYILPKKFVQKIIDQGIADEFVLRNEDKAVGVWVDRIAKTEQGVEYVNLPGTDGYDEHATSTTRSGRYGTYPHVLHHHLPGESIKCLHLLDAKFEKDLEVDQCF